MSVFSKIFSITAITALVSLPICAFDFGFLIDGTEKAYTDDLSSISGSEGWTNELISTFTANAKSSLNQAGTQKIAAEGNFTYKLTNDLLGESNDLKTADLTLLKYTGLFQKEKKKSVLSLGRFFVADSTGLVLSLLNDGVMYQYLSNKVNASLYAGWTGLTNAQNTSILSRNYTEDDDADDVFMLDAEKVYYFNDSYALSSVSLSLPYLFFNQTLTLEGIALIGTKGINGDNSGNWRAFGTLSLNGPLAASLFYKLYTCFEKEKDMDIANLSSLYFDYYTTYKGLSFSFGGVYASGEDGAFASFKGISSQTAFQANGDTQYSGLIKGGISASIKPIDALFCKLGSDVVFKDRAKEESESQELKYHGVQVYGAVSYQIFTDLKTSLSVSDYFAEDKADNKLLGTLSLTLAL